MRGTRRRRHLNDEAECGDVLRLIASARRAMDSLMAEGSGAWNHRA
jgi:DNA-binding FrmR family transcriptional regulator